MDGKEEHELIAQLNSNGITISDGYYKRLYGCSMFYVKNIVCKFFGGQLKKECTGMEASFLLTFQRLNQKFVDMVPTIVLKLLMIAISQIIIGEI